MSIWITWLAIIVPHPAHSLINNIELIAQPQGEGGVIPSYGDEQDIVLGLITNSTHVASVLELHIVRCQLPSVIISIRFLAIIQFSKHNGTCLAIVQLSLTGTTLVEFPY